MITALTTSSSPVDDIPRELVVVERIGRKPLKLAIDVVLGRWDEDPRFTADSREGRQSGSRIDLSGGSAPALL
jgi:hypothetical protein